MPLSKPSSRVSAGIEGVPNLFRLRVRRWLGIAVQTVRAWHDDGIPRLAAALSYYTIFSLAPLLVIVLGILGLVIDRASMQHHLLVQVQQLIGERAAEGIGVVLDHATSQKRGA